ncbi:hypothetical protein DAPPUDRAFT_101700 [Daphnia pulex]|uniref:C2 domain-containing protein n=1 Tax=Daphnia pulex TaxID=6669 RepID=E9GE92_DAPPU|nr:hypothetical protein DAPPUDRAFT_101700 [Daphnia pulex]|eukprot:EFX82224.1 hypothetical protein DAPPUDRAFT_101700 [Daphnia pulex]
MIDILAVTILAFLFAYVCWDIGRDCAFMDLFSRKTDIQTRLSAVNQIKIKPDVFCATKPAIDKGFSTPSGDDLNQQSCLRLMAKDDDQNLTVLENERLKNELSLLQSQLTDSSSKLQMFQNVYDELATTKMELEEKKRVITDITEKNLRLKNDESEKERLANELSLVQSQLTDSSSELKLFQSVHDELETTKSELEYNKRVITEISELNLRLTYDELEKERLKNELSLVQSQLTDSHFQLRQFHDELETTKCELEEKKSLITAISVKNLRLTSQDSRLRREIEDRDRLIESSQAEVEKLRISINNHTDTIEQLLDHILSSQTPRNDEEVGIKVEKPDEIPAAIEQVETLQNNPESIKFQPREAILTIENLSDEITVENQELDEAPGEPVSEPKEIPVEEHPSNQQLGMDETRPESLSESLTETIVDTGNVTNKDQVGETELLEIAEETIIPEESEHIEEQPSEAQSKSTDNLEDPQVEPQITEQSELLNDRAMDEKPEEPSTEIVSKPKDTPAEVPPSCEHELDTGEKRPEPTSLNENWQKTIDDTGNVTNEDPVLGENELLEIDEKTIIPEEIEQVEDSEQVEEQPSKAQSKSADNQFRHKPGDPQVQLPNPEKSDLMKKIDNQPHQVPNPEKSQLLQNRAIDRKPKTEPEPLADTMEGNKTPGKFKIRVLRGVNFPEAKDSDKYYVSVSIMWAEDGRGKTHVQGKKINKSKTILGIQPEWNKDFTIETPDPEWCLMTIKLKKSSKLGWETSTVGSVVVYASALKVNQVNRLRLFKQSRNPVGNTYLELEIEYLPEVIPRPEPKDTPAEVPPSNNKKNDNQPLHKPKDPHALPPNPEKSQLSQKRAMDEKPKAPAKSQPDCKEGNQTPKDFKIRVQRGVNLPEAKDSDQYYVSMRVQEGRGTIRQQDKKVGKSKTIRGSQPEWNKDFTIKTTNPEECQMTIKVKKSSKFCLKKSTVGFVKLDVSSLSDGLNKLQLYDESHNPVGKACLEVEITSSAKV